MNRFRYHPNRPRTSTVPSFVPQIESPESRLPPWATPPIIPLPEPAERYRSADWRRPPVDPGATWVSSRASVQESPPTVMPGRVGPIGGGLLDPIERPDPPVRDGLLDPAGWEEFRAAPPQPRIKRKDLPPELQDFPIGPEGGLLGAMLAEYVEPDTESAPTRGSRPGETTGGSQADDPSTGSGDLPVPPRKPSPPIPYPQIPLPPSADWADKGFGGPRGDVSIPTIDLEARRRANILADRPARFDIEDNPEAVGGAPFHADHTIGRVAVKRYRQLIDEEARRQGVDPDLVKAIVYVENAQGHYFGAARLAELLGLADSLFPMNINPALWSSLAGPDAELSDPADNIRAGVTLLRRIQDRLEQPSVAKIASMYNSGAKERVSDFGARVATVYATKDWRR